jgi:hypothetical protein
MRVIEALAGMRPGRVRAGYYLHRCVVRDRQDDRPPVFLAQRTSVAAWRAASRTPYHIAVLQGSVRRQVRVGRKLHLAVGDRMGVQFTIQRRHRGGGEAE